MSQTFGPHCIYIYLLCFPQELEKALDVFNIVLARQQVQMEVWQHVPKQKAIDILTFLIRCSKFAFSLHRWCGQDRSWLLKRLPLRNRVEEASSAAFLARKKGRKKRKRRIKSLRVSVLSLIYLLNVPLNKCFFWCRPMFMYMYLLSGIDSIMTPEEKTKLYTAIGYSGSSHNLALPKHVSAPSQCCKCIFSSHIKPFICKIFQCEIQPFQ